MAHELLTPDSCALALIDHQPQMFFGSNSHERTVVQHNVQILAKSAKLFKVPTISPPSLPTRSVAISLRKCNPCFRNRSRSTAHR
jgi:nicotinamidase-related amidase